MHGMTREQGNELKTKAEGGDSEAQWEIGSWLEDGLVDSNGFVLAHPDACAAVRWYRQSAIAGNAAGQTRLGVCLCTGRGVRRDDTEALHWFKRALRPTISRASTEIAETIVAQYSGINVQSPAAMETHLSKLGVDATQASALGAIRSRRYVAFVRQSPTKALRKQGAKPRCSTSASRFMRGEA